MADPKAMIGIGAKDETGAAFQSIERSVQKLQSQAATIGKSSGDTKLYELAVRGASQAQLDAAKSAIKLQESYARGAEIGSQIKAGLLTIGAAAATGLIAAYVAFDQLIKRAGDFQDLAEEIGGSAVDIASLAVPAATAGVAIESIAAASVKLTKGLVGVDDESKAAGVALAALGLNVEDFKKLDPVAQYEAVGKALGGYADGASKTAVAVALFGKSGAEQLKVFKALEEQGGRQVILTAEQIAQADNYADKQAKSRAELSLYASAIATQALPAVTVFTNSIADLANELLQSDGQAKKLGGNTSIADFAKNSAIFIASLVDRLGDLRDGFREVGNAAGAVAAILAVPVGPGMLDQIRSINKGLSEDQAKLFKSNLEGRVIANFAKANGAKLGSDPQELARRGKGPKPLPELAFDGVVKPDKQTKVKDTSKQEGKAQLAFDLEQIKKAAEAEVAAFGNAEKILEARRAATLVNEKEYYAAKLGFLNLNSQAQEQALKEEIGRLSEEKLTGKDKIDNLRKIAEAQAKLDKVRESAVTNIEVLKTQEVAANAKIAQSYVDATKAAQAYLETVNKQNAREIAGIGRGDAFRADQAGRSMIEDKQTTQRQGLEGDLRRGQIDQTQFDTYLAIVNDTYAKEIQAYGIRTAAIKEKQADWVNGATEAFANYQSKARDVAGNTALAFSSAFTTLEDGFASSVSKSILHGESFSQSIANVATTVADEFLTAGVRMAAQWAISQASITSATAVGTATRSTIESAAAAESVLLWAGAAVKNIMTSAWEAMAGAYKAIAGIPLIGPVLAPVAAGAAFIAVAALAKNVVGGRALGGPVSAGEMYEVNEKGPELLSAGGKDFLMMGRHPGSVMSNEQLRGNRDSDASDSKGGAITIVNNTSAKIGKVTEQRLSNGDRALVIEEAVTTFALQLGDPNSRPSRAMSRNFSSQRNR